MAVRFFNGIQINVPDGWSDLSTVIVAPRAQPQSGDKPTINLVVKRRPVPQERATSDTIEEYLEFMRQTFGHLEGLHKKEMLLGGVKGQAVRFVSEANGKRFMQVTLLYRSGGDEISATVTQLEGDSTSLRDIEKLLSSVRPAAGGLFGIK